MIDFHFHDYYFRHIIFSFLSPPFSLFSLIRRFQRFLRLPLLFSTAAAFSFELRRRD